MIISVLPIFSHFLPLALFCVQDALENEQAKKMAKKERERLKLQDKQKREQVEKMRQTLNADAAAGEVRQPY